MWFVVVDPSVGKEPLWNWQLILRVALWPNTQFGHYFSRQGNAATSIPIRGPWDDCADDGTNDSLPTRGLALGWLERCKRNADGQHGLCGRQDRNFLPTRLLDVRKALQTGKVCLVLPAEQPTLFDSEGSRDYVTLSHCWGAWGAKQNPLLLAANLADRQNEGLTWGLLPQTFRDAFKIASWFGWDWLWIDSLCIIQDSQADWKTEAAMMDRVYQNAQINISADSGVDSRAGCFSLRGEHDITPLEMKSRESKDSLMLTTENAFGWMQSATSLSRAWIHRERQLSRRILHFTEKEVVWECCGLGKSGFASETLPGGAPFDRLFEGDTKFQTEWAELGNASEGSAKERLRKIFQLWNQTCEGLSNKSVTFATDMPVILSSLAKEVHRMIPGDEYACGLWRSTLPESLAWCTEGVKPDDTGFIAPSWSWLNVANPVKLALQNSYQNKLPVAEVLDIRVDLDSHDPYGAVTKGDLHMEGYLRRLHCHFIDSGRFIISVIEEDDKGDDLLRLIGPDWNEDDGYMCQLTHDVTIHLDHEEHECYAFFTTIAEWAQDLQTCSRKLTCLLLDAVEGGDNTYRRIGTLDKLSDEYSFKMRYTVATGSNSPEAGLPRSLYVENAIGYQGPPANGNQQNRNLTHPSTGSMWDLLVEFIRRNRWAVISTHKKEKERLRQLAEGGEEQSPDLVDDNQGLGRVHGHQDEEHNEDRSEGPVYPPAIESGISEVRNASSERGDDRISDLITARDEGVEPDNGFPSDPRCPSYSSLIRCIRNHPSSGIETLFNDDEERQMIAYAAPCPRQRPMAANCRLQNRCTSLTMYLTL